MLEDYLEKVRVRGGVGDGVRRGRGRGEVAQGIDGDCHLSVSLSQLIYSPPEIV